MAYQETIQIANIDREKIDPATLQSIEALNALLQLLTPLAIVTSGTGKLSIDANVVGGALASAGNISTVTTVGAVTNAVNIGGIGGFDMQRTIAQSAYASATLRNITF